MKPDEVIPVLREGARMGCTEALFTFGERPELVPGFLPLLEKIGYGSIISYCRDLCRISIREGLLPHTNAGILTPPEMRWLAPYNASMGLMLETTAEVPAHRKSPGKDPKIRLSMIADAGGLKIPFTTGLLVGIGESRDDRYASLESIARLHQRYHHIQEVIIQNFCPRQGMDMEQTPSPGLQEMRDTVQAAREILPDDIAVQIPPNLADARDLIRCGATDLGGISPVTLDYINPDHPWPELRKLKKLTEGYRLQERLCIYPSFITRGWYHPRLSVLLTKLHDTIQTRDLT